MKECGVMTKKKTNEKKRISKGLVATFTTTNTMDMAFMDSWAALMRHVLNWKDYVVEFTVQQNSSLHLARDAVCRSAIKNGYDWVLMLDSDMVFDKLMIDYLLSVHADTVTGLAVQRNSNAQPCVYREMIIENGKAFELKPFLFDSVPNEPFEVAACGAACLLIKTKALKKLEEIDDSFFFRPYGFTSEDISFCHRLSLAGIKIMCDPRPLIGHVGTKIYTIKDFLANQILLDGSVKY